MKSKALLRIIFIIIGLGIAFFVAKKIGFSLIIENLKTLSWRAVPILAISAVWYLLFTFAWNEFLKRLTGHMPLWELYRAKISGEAINTVTPVSFIGGDPVRIYILKRHFPVTKGAASVVVDRTLHTMAVLMIIFLGMIAAFWRLPFLPLNMRYGLPIVLIISILFMAFVFSHQKRGLFSFLMYLAKRLHLKKSFSLNTINKLRELDRYIADFYINSPKSFWMAITLHFSGRVLGILEIFLVGKIFYPEFTLYAALLLGALSPLINFMFAFIPGALGIMEGAYSGVLYLLNMPPEIGLSIQIYRRLRAAFWIMMGFLALNIHSRKKVTDEVMENIQTSD